MVVVGSSRPVVVNQSAASIALCLTTFVMFLAAVSLCLASSHTWEKLANAWQRWMSAVPVPAGHAGTFTFCLFLGLVCQLTLHIHYYRTNDKAIEDQGDYLRVARQIHEQGSLSGLVHGLWTGTFREANRHPLYVVLLSLSPTFEWGKQLSIGFALLMTAATATWIWQRHGAVAGMICCALLSTNLALLHSGTLVACESLLALLMMAAWQMLAVEKVGSGRMFLAGIASGLAYLSKASALFFNLALGLMIITDRSHSYWRRVTLLGIMVSGFAIASSLLLVRNVRAFNTPFYSFNNRFLFADDYDSGVDHDPGFLRGLKNYAQTHTLMQASRRLLGGLATQAFVACRSLGPLSLDSGRVPIGAGLFFLAAAVCVSRRRELAFRTLILWLVIWWLFFAWYSPIATSDRFWLPLLGPLLIAASQAIAQAAVLLQIPERAAFIISLAWICLWTVAGHLGKTPF